MQAKKSAQLQRSQFKPRRGLEALAVFDQLPDSAGVTSAVAELVLGKGRTSIYELCKKGVLDTRQIGKSQRILVGSIKRLQGIA